MFKPMLASKLEGTPRFPVYASPKYDGIRALVVDGVVVSRNMKPIPSKFVQENFSKFEGFDGELICGNPATKNCFARTISACMTRDCMTPVDYFVFDILTHPERAFRFRYDQLIEILIGKLKLDSIVLVTQTIIHTYSELSLYEQNNVGLGYEGIMIRDPNAPYKFGRSTSREGYLLKVKRFDDSEAIIVDIEELDHNDNVAEKDAFGRTKRSSAKEFKRGAGILGAFVVRDIKSKVKFSIGTGFTHSERKEYYDEYVIGKIVKYKFQEVGSKDGVPRFPVFIGFRHEGDM